MASGLQGTGQQLEQRLQHRVSSHYLTKQGIMQNPNLDHKLQGAPSWTDSTKYHKLDRSLQGAARQLENRQRRDTLTAALNARPDMQELLDAGYIPEYVIKWQIHYNQLPKNEVNY